LHETVKRPLRLSGFATRCDLPRPYACVSGRGT